MKHRSAAPRRAAPQGAHVPSTRSSSSSIGEHSAASQRRRVGGRGRGQRASRANSLPSRSSGQMPQLSDWNLEFRLDLAAGGQRRQRGG